MIVGGILIAIFLFSLGFFNHMMMQRGQSHRQGEQRITETTANALATLALHKLQFDSIRQPVGALKAYLSLPVSKLVDLPELPLKLEGEPPDLTQVLQAIKKPIQAQGDFSYKIFYSCKKSDFSDCGIPKYPREKKGFIRLAVRTTFKKFGDPGSGVTEEFRFSCRVKVVAAIIPVLSKFNLYIEDVIDGGQPFKLNLTSTNPDGELKSPETAKPFILNNGDVSIQTRLDEFIEAPRGLVYLGGGKMFLNLARGWGSASKFGEGFHFFAAGKADGLYTIRWEGSGDIAVMNWDMGICNETVTSPSKEWWEFIERSPVAQFAKMNSIFRLFGNELKPSPTFIFGEVYRTFLRARAFKTLATDGSGRPLFRPSFMPYVNDLPTWQDFCNSNPPPTMSEMASIGTFATFVGLTNDAAGFSRYKKEYASNLAFTPFNTSLAFLATRNQDANPLHFFGSDAISSFMKTNPMLPPEKLKEIPAKFQIYSGVTSLVPMQPFLDKMEIPGKRTAWKINPALEGTSLLDSLKNRGLLRGRKLDLNGWIYVEGDNTVTFNDNLEVISNGGIVLEKGNFIVQNQIKCQNEAAKQPILHLVTKNGNITVNYNGIVDASLTAKGKVTIGNSGRPNIRGSMAMSRFDVSSASQGADLDYNTALAAKPDLESTDVDSEAPLLSFAFEPLLEILP